MSIVRTLLLLGLIIILFLVSGAAYYFYSRTQELKYDPNVRAQEELDTLVAEVGELIVLPEGEKPTVATVSDPERLKDQTFFAKAKAGDKVLLYSTARKAYLYDPIAKKIIEVAPLSIGNAPESAVQNTSGTP